MASEMFLACVSEPFGELIETNTASTLYRLQAFSEL
jgi:hypothetical protein